jgi:hypothetical protein
MAHTALYAMSSFTTTSIPNSIPVLQCYFAYYNLKEYHSVIYSEHKITPSTFQNTKIRIYKTIILPLVFPEYEMKSIT